MEELPKNVGVETTNLSGAMIYIGEATRSFLGYSGKRGE